MDPAVEYINFDLRIERGASGTWVVRAHAEKIGDAHEEFPFDLASLGAHDAGLAKDTADPDSVRALGARLYQFLFRPKIKSLLDRSLGAAQDPRVRDHHTGVRIRLLLGDDNPEIAAIPWELVYSEEAHEFLGTSNETPIIRFLECPQGMRDPEAWLPLNLLIVIPTVVDLDVDGEKSRIRAAVEGLDPEVKVKFLGDDGPVTRERLSAELIDVNYDFLHFIGHGRFVDGHGALRLNKSEVDEDWVPAEALREMVKNYESLRLVVLNTCQGAEGSDSDAFAGVASQLVLAGVPAVVAMQFPIRDEEAKTFASAFYRALFHGSERGRVDAAVTMARSALSRDNLGRRSVALPVLHMRYNEGVLFRVVKGDGTVPANFSFRGAAKDRALIREGQDALKRLGPGETDARKQQEQIIERARARLRYRKWAIAAPVSVVLFLLVALAAGLFERVPLTWMTAASPVWFGDPLAGSLPVDSIVLVVSPDTLSLLERHRHAALLDRLSRAGARVVAFDFRFRRVSPDDSMFALAIDSARARGTEVVGGANLLAGDSLALAPALVNHLRTGLDCLGQNPLTPSTVVPVYWSPAGKATKLHGFGLEVLAAWRDAAIRYPDRSEVALYRGDQEIDHILLTKITTVFRPQPGCSVMTSGSQYGEMLSVRSPVRVWRDSTRRFDYARVERLPPESLSWVRGRIVLVGAQVEADRFVSWSGFRRDVRYGMESHADAIATMLGNAEPRPLAPILERLLVAILAGLAAAFACRGLRPPFRRVILIATAVLVTLVILSSVLYWLPHRLLNLLYPLLGFVLTLGPLLRIRRRWSL